MPTVCSTITSEMLKLWAKVSLQTKSRDEKRLVFSQIGK
jgi:hypothetical protein